MTCGAEWSSNVDAEFAPVRISAGRITESPARSACATTIEDDAHPRVEVELFAALVRGFGRGLGSGFSPLERELLVPATQAFARVLALRFLTDHLEGDRYFRIHRPGQNLDRARAQLALLKALRAAEGELSRAAR